MQQYKRSLLFDEFTNIINSSEPMPVIVTKLNDKAKKILSSFEKIIGNELLSPVIYYTKNNNFIFLKQNTTQFYTSFLMKFALKIITSPYVSFTYKNLNLLLKKEKKLITEAVSHFESHKEFIESFFDAKLITDPVIRKKINDNEKIHIPFIENTSPLYISSFNYNNYAFFKDFLLQLPFIEALEVEFIKPYTKLKKYDGLIAFSDLEYTKIIREFIDEELIEKYSITSGDIEKILKNLKFAPLNKYVLLITIHIKNSHINDTFKINSFIEYLNKNKIFVTSEEQFIAFNELNLITFFI